MERSKHWWAGWRNRHGYTQFELLIDRIAGQQCSARVLSPPPIAAGSTRFRAPFPLAGRAGFCTAIEQGGRDLLRAGVGGSESMESLGKRLFEAVFQGEVKDSFERALGYAQASGTELLLRIRLADPELAIWPWEFLWSEKVRDFLSFHRVAIVRQLEGGTEVLPPQKRGPLRILVVSADLEDAPLNADEEIRQLRDALRIHIVAGRIVLDDLREATQASLVEKLGGGGYLIVHFIGHGHFDAATKRGFLWLNDGKVEARELAKILSKARLVFLNCCHGARGDPHDLFAGVAQRLYLLGVPSVVAMQCSVQDNVAITFASRFYRRLALGEALESAMSEARRRLAIKDGLKLEWGIPVLYLRSPGESLVQFRIWFYLRKWVPRLLLAWALIALNGASDSYTCPSPRDVYIRFTRIPAGKFVMGSGKGGATPEHEVRLTRPFCISTYEVTQRQWTAVMGENPSKVRGRSFPVTNVDDLDVREFFTQLNRTDPGARNRLPTEAQWEYSARGGTKTDFYFEGTGDDLYKYGNCKAADLSDGYENITSVGSFPANPWGLHDIYGNVSELVEDSYMPYEASAQTDAKSYNVLMIKRVHRGGSWETVPGNCNSFDRSHVKYSYGRHDVGFRLVRDPVPIRKAQR